MRAIGYLGWRRLRQRGRSWLGILLVVLIASGLVMALAAGGRRAETVYPRFLKAQHAPDVIVTAGAGLGLADLDLDRVAALPSVVGSARIPTFFTLGRTGAGRLIPPRVVAAQVADAHVFAGGLDRVKLVAGRTARPDRVDELVADQSFQKSFGIGVGSTVTLRFATPEGLPSLFAGINDATPEALEVGPLVRFRVVGLGVIPGELPPITSAGLPSMWLTPAFGDRYGSGLAHTDTIGVRLRAGAAGSNGFKSSVEQLAGGRPVLFFTQQDSTTAVERAFRSQALSLYILAALLAAVALLFVGQILGRLARSTDDRASLSAMGMTIGERAAVTAFQSVLVSGAGAVAGAVGAYLFSPRMPLGLARLADPSPGFSFDPLVLVVGVASVVVVTGGLGAFQGWRAERAGFSGDMAAREVTRSRPLQHLPVSAAVGLGFAFRAGRGRGAVSRAGTIVGVGLGLLTLTAAVVFGSSLSHLLATPRLWGATWQARLGDGFAPDPGGMVGAGLAADPWVHDLAAGAAGQLELNGRVRVDAFAVDAVKGHIIPLALTGRAPMSENEIFVGTAALRELRASVGDSVTVSVGASSTRMRVVGRGPLPLGAFRDSGHSALLTFSGFKRLVPNAEPNIYLADGPPGTAPAAADAYLASHHAGIGVFPHELPVDFANFGQAQGLPRIIGVVLALLASVSLVHALVSANRARRRDLAILKTLGFVRSEIVAAVTFYSLGVVAAAATVAIPLGVASGRWSWYLFADQVGAAAVPVVRLGDVAGVAVAVLVLGGVLAIGPARAAARVKPVAVLRTE